MVAGLIRDEEAGRCSMTYRLGIYGGGGIDLAVGGGFEHYLSDGARGRAFSRREAALAITSRSRWRHRHHVQVNSYATKTHGNNTCSRVMKYI